MKRKIANFIITFLGLAVFLLILGRLGYYETHYFMTGTVLEISNDFSILLDESGETWEIENPSLELNEQIKITFNNNGTELNRYDDIITSVERINK